MPGYISEECTFITAVPVAMAVILVSCSDLGPRERWDSRRFTMQSYYFWLRKRMCFLSKQSKLQIKSVFPNTYWNCQRGLQI